MKNLPKSYIVIFFISSLYILNCKTINSQINFAQNHRLVSEETRTLYRTLRYNDKKLFQDDYITGYLDSNPQIIGFEILQRISSFFGDLRKGLHRYMHFPLWILVITFIILSSWRIGGWVIAWSSGCISISSSLFLHQMVGAVPHSFAYPILATIILINILGKPVLFILLIIFSGLFYPPMIPIIGINLAVFLFLLDKEYQGNLKNWSSTNKVLLLGFSSVIAFFFLLPHLKPLTDYGPRLTSSSLLPEAQNGGRHFYGFFNPISYCIAKLINQYDENLSWQLRLSIIAISIGIFIIGIFFRDRKNIYLERLFSFILACIICFGLFYIKAPHLLYRFLLYPTPLLIFILLPLSLFLILKKLSFPDRKAYETVIVFSIAYSFLISGTDSRKSGYHYTIDRSYLAAYQFIETLDKNTLIAGFPGQISLTANEKSKISLIEYVPYFSKRKAYITHKLHYPTYLDYTLELRKRMGNIIQIYSTKSIEDLIAFRNKEKVRYLIVEPELLDHTPEYFNPFDKLIEKKWYNFKLEDLQIIKQKKNALVYENEKIYILDLNKL